MRLSRKAAGQRTYLPIGPHLGPISRLGEVFDQEGGASCLVESGPGVRRGQASLSTQ